MFKISLKFVPKGPIENNSALVPIMAWRQIGDKPLSSESMLILGGDELNVPESEMRPGASIN